MRASVLFPSVSVLALLAFPGCDAPGTGGDPQEGPEAAERRDASPEATGQPAAGSPEDGSAARGPQAKAIEETVRGLFDAMREGDSASARSLFHPAARLSGPVEKEGRVLLRTSSAESFVEAVGSAEQEWDERISGLEIQVDGRLATAWMDYVFYLGGELSHCGVNAMQLYRSDDGWRIFQVADTRRTEGCPDPRGEGG